MNIVESSPMFMPWAMDQGKTAHCHSVRLIRPPKSLSRPVIGSRKRASALRPSASVQTGEAVTAARQQLADFLGPAPLELIVLDFPNPVDLIHFQPPQSFSVLSFLLSHPLITFVLALFLSFAIPRLWRAFVKFVVIPATVLAAGFVVVKNPETFSNAGTFIKGFTQDHPYFTSASILIGLMLILSPYLLTALLILFLATGIPQLPAPIKRFLPAPVVEFEQQLESFSDATRGPVESIKEQALKLGYGIQSTGGQFFQQFQNNQEAPALSQRPQKR